MSNSLPAYGGGEWESFLSYLMGPLLACNLFSSGWWIIDLTKIAIYDKN